MITSHINNFLFPHPSLLNLSHPTSLLSPSLLLPFLPSSPSSFSSFLPLSPSLPLSLSPSLPLRGTDEGADRDPNSSLPEYESNSPEPGIPPPDYRDALQDVIISSGPTATVCSLISRPHLAWKSLSICYSTCDTWADAESYLCLVLFCREFLPQRFLTLNNALCTVSLGLRSYLRNFLEACPQTSIYG